ncbi:MAG: twitching motility protein PilT [bacterium]|nr:twitching motility protein PilT [bacterium]
MKILMDTNFLFIPFQFKVDIFAELDRICLKYELYVVDRTLDELEGLAQNKGKQGQAARLALSFIKAKNVNIINTREITSESVDNIIASQQKEGYIIATQDKGLKNKLKKPMIVLRQKSYLEMI